MSQSVTAINLAVFGATHAVVDAACAGLLFSVPILHNVTPNDFFYMILLYNVLAFGFQPLCGRLVDHFRSPRLSAIVGCGLLAGAAVGVSFQPISSVILAGVGNALFHIGGGTVSLNLTPNRASAPGIFVAPGAIGLAAGIFIGKSGWFAPLPFVLLLAALCVGISLIKIPDIDYVRDDHSDIGSLLLQALSLLFVSVVIRSLVGLAVVYPWKSDILSLTLLILAVAGGKALGGILADRYGWRKVTTAALITSAPLVAFGMTVPWLGMLGMLLFNMTMAVTLAAVAGLFPGRPGFGFGVPCLALLMGGLLTVTDVGLAFTDHSVVITVILLSAATLWGGLILCSRLRGSLLKNTEFVSLSGSSEQENLSPIYDR